MADQEQVALLKQGVKTWNEWRSKNPMVNVDLRIAELQGMDLRGADLHMVDLTGADLSQAKLSGVLLSLAQMQGANLSEADLGYRGLDVDEILEGANLSSADLRKANLSRTRLVCADLSWADLSGANLEGANLEEANLGNAKLCKAIMRNARISRANLFYTNLSETDLRGAYLGCIILFGTDLRRADITGCRIETIGARYAKWEEAVQHDLTITSTIAVDNLSISMFVQLLLYQEDMWNLFEKVTSSIVLIVGHFPNERSVAANILKRELRAGDYIPITFDYILAEQINKKAWLDILTRLAKFVIVDLTGAMDIAQELRLLVSQHPSVPVQPLVQISADDFAISEELAAFPSVLEPYRYQSAEDIQRDAKELIARAERRAKELAGR